MEAPRSLPGSRRSIARYLARCLRLGALTAALLVAAVAPESATAAIGVEVSVPGAGPAKIFDEAEFTKSSPLWTEPGEYTLRGRPGEAGIKFPRSGVPVRALIEKAEVNPDTFGYLTIVRTDGTTAYLPRSDFAEPWPFPEGPALITAESGTIRFLRPLTSDPNDVNAPDSPTTSGGETLKLGLHDGEILSVDVSPSTTSADAGQFVQFNATSSASKDGEEVKFKWSFGDGTSAEGPSVSHAFSGSGTFEVRATAVGSAESGGESGPVFVVIGNPPPAAQPGAVPIETTPKRHKKKAAGPSGKGREGRGGDGKQAKGGGHPTPQGSTVNGGNENRGGDPRPTESPPSFESTLPTFFPPFEEEPVPESAPPSRAPAGAPAGSAKPAKTPEPNQPAPGHAQTVEGTLVANYFDPAAAAAAAANSAGSSGAESSPGATDGGGGTLPVAALIVLGLLAAGVLYEWRGGRVRAR
jgi:hypothetical protein